ncbi:heavy metal-associated isoprenylated plant protein 28 isoform X2 [Cryptomeria japonica]|nr:heavy metal-associated isoprenylated plant protein 28 isoform X2 [Cryptomeria japonica]XP_057861887.2 heavy metal-associated isoprenylated plant protein 28 isoform X2 [Cryptomeria japonica]XP_057861888.2 heavy metal-associated isoprenylated plant protein 28 isoform X2 [Cryptomeria japonica]XP_057861889.2 heavy metal-associated isoprenylated plant protein 28 isoform X2 [Cryptomeria japonica]
MEVHMDCGGCQRKIRKALSKLQGVDSIDIDMEQQKVTVSGDVDQMTVLGAVRNTGKKAELWAYPHYYYNYDYGSGAATYAYMHTYSHEVQGQVQDYYNRDAYPYYQGEGEAAPPSSNMMDHKATTLFSDENPHACSIM